MAGEECWMDEVGGESGPEVVGGLGNVLGMGGELGVRSGAGCSLLVPREMCARMTVVCLAGSDRQMARNGMVGLVAACSMCPSWAEPLVGGDGVMRKGVHTGVSPTHSPLVWGPGSGQEESQAGEGWTGAESGSRLGSWSV